MTEPDDPVGVLRRWEESGALWRVLARTRDTMTVGLYPCTGGEEIDRFTSASGALRTYVGDREGSDD